jgi:hypothetical protein
MDENTLKNMILNKKSLLSEDYYYKTQIRNIAKTKTKKNDLNYVGLNNIYKK